MITKKANGARASRICGVAGALLAAGALAACGPIHSAGPEQVYANNPSVTYTYSNDQELLMAGDRASAFCGQYQARSLRSGTITSNPDGTSSVVFECVPLASAPAPAVAMAAPAAPAATPMTYSYSTSQELLQASQNAESYCMRLGKRSSATVTTNPNGSKAASFHCVP
ncbi:MAG: hypothetical protein GEU87_09165 [Alphaproteobacteria bacterium]|nr:hypothetical protein [Alphaproteobacteria bacterium]